VNKTWAIINDVQVPWQDKQVLNLVTDFIRDLKPHGIVLNGDIVDCYAISDFNKDPDRIKTWGWKPGS
jgi:metallophosphoesterase superfamily enzyme